MTVDPHAQLHDAEERAGLTSKGLAEGKVGTFSGAILGISSVAPGYTLTASIGDLHRRLRPDVSDRVRLPRTELAGP